MKLILILTTVLLLNLNAYAQDVSLQYKGLTLNANLEKTSNWSTGPVVLMTHGTLAHNKMEIMSTLQNLLKDQGVSSLAINLSLGLDNRQGFYDCTVPHSHKHEDAVNEIGLWLNWLQQQGVKQVVLLGHSRGGNQTAWYATEHDSPLIKKSFLSHRRPGA